jgi:protease-4
LYYGELLKNLDVNARVYKVGTYKSAVEPYIRDGMSDPARENYQQLYGAMWSEWQDNVKKARPKANLALVTGDPVGWFKAAGSDAATAAKNAGLVDRIGDKVAFGKRVAALAGKDRWDKTPGAYAKTELEPWLADNEPDDTGKAIGVVTIAGEIVDGDAGPGSAGGDRIAKVLDQALDDDLAGLVVRVDSPGGSVLASEEIRRAILRHKAKGIPVAVSMGNLAASGGYWVSTPGQRIFAEPDTITGSIGIFGIVPTFENTLAQYGVTSDGVRTSPLSGQPDILGGLTPEVESLIQATIENGYRRFIGIVGQSRHKTPEQVDAIGQGRIWDGGTARQLGLVDQLGGLDDALAYAAQAAKLGDDWHAQYLGEEDDTFRSLLVEMLQDDDDDESAQRTGIAGIAGARQAALAAKLAGDLDVLLGGNGVQAYCLECPPTAAAAPTRREAGLLAQLVRLVGLTR